MTIQYNRSVDVVSRAIAGETLLVPIRQRVEDLSAIYTLNETAAAIWSLMDGNHTLEEVCTAIVTEFEVSEEQAKSDVLALTDRLVEMDLLVKV